MEYQLEFFFVLSFTFLSLMVVRLEAWRWSRIRIRYTDKYHTAKVMHVCNCSGVQRTTVTILRLELKAHFNTNVNQTSRISHSRLIRFNMPFTLEEAKVDDAAAIAKIFTSDETSNFLRMQLGTVDPSVLNEGMTERLAESIQKEGHVYIIARNDDTGEIVSYAHWALPRDEMEVVVEQSPEVGCEERSCHCCHKTYILLRRKQKRPRNTGRNSYQE